MSYNDSNEHEKLEGNKWTSERKQNRTHVVCWDVHIQFIGNSFVVIVVITLYYTKNEKKNNWAMREGEREREEKRRESVELFIFPGTDI